GRLLRRDVELDAAQVDASIAREARRLLHLRSVAAARLAHAGVDGVAGPGERARAQLAEPAGGSGHEDDALHGLSSRRVAQTMPPFARSPWPFTHPPSGPTRNETAAAMSSGVPSRSSGARRASSSIVSCDLPRRKRSVAVGPGAIAFTVTERPRSST